MNSDRALASVDVRLGEGRSISVDHLDLGVSTSDDVFRLLLGLGNNSLVLVCQPLLISDLSVDNGILVRVRQVDLEQHEGADLRVGFSHLSFEFLSHVVTDLPTHLPILGCSVVTGNLEHRIACNPSENRLVVVLEEAVHVRQLVFLQLVLEAAVDGQLETFLRAGLESRLLRGRIIGEFERLVDAGEVNKRVKDADVM